MRLRSLILLCGAVSLGCFVTAAALVFVQMDVLSATLNHSRALARLDAAATDTAIAASRFGHHPSEPNRLVLVEANAALAREAGTPQGVLVAYETLGLRDALRAISGAIEAAALAAAQCDLQPEFNGLCDTVERLARTTTDLRTLAAPAIEAAKARAQRIAQRANLAMFAIFVALGWVVLSFWAHLQARILDPLVQLRLGFASLGAGALHHRVPKGRDDEFGEIGRAFNAMAENLQRVTATRGALEEEIRRRLALEADLRRRNAALTEANAELDAFARIAAHDLRAPVRGVAALTDWLEEDLGAEAAPELRFHLSLMRGRIARLGALLDALQRFAELGRANRAMESVAPRVLVERIAADLGIADRFEVRFEGCAAPFPAPEALIDMAVSELLRNAAKHHDRETGSIVVRVALQNGYRSLTVADDGPGVAPDLQERVFEPFQTLKPRDDVEGAGMGLTILRKAARMNGGAITVESPLVEGRGAAFTLRWPERPGRSGEPPT